MKEVFVSSHVSKVTTCTSSAYLKVPISASQQDPTSGEDKKDKPDALPTDLHYTINDTPPWPVCIVLGFQVRQFLRILLILTC